jgi:alanine racemase
LPHPAAVELIIDLQAIADNYRLLAAKVKPAECAAAVKADAYGLGMAKVAGAREGGMPDIFRGDAG